MCARLDALASSIASEDEPNRTAFMRLVTNYGGFRDLMSSVSVGDLYYELGYHHWLAEGLIPKPGRVHKFSDLNDPVVELLDRSGISLTVDAAQALLALAMRTLAVNFGCRPGQRTTKQVAVKPRVVADALEAAFRRSRDPELRQNLVTAFQPLLDKMTVSAILYEKFRNNAVHGVKVEVDEAKFFTADEPFSQPFYSECYPPFLLSSSLPHS